MTRWFYILETSTMIEKQEASSSFSVFRNKPMSSPFEWQNSLRVLYFGKVNHECNPGGILKILYAHKWIHIFSFLGILKCNFRGWWRKKAAPRWSGTSKKGIHDWFWIYQSRREIGGGMGGEQWMEVKTKWTENEIPISS